MITRIQDEAHRFAIEYHRSLRSKTQVKSALDDIPGVGPARRKALMRAFPSLEAIRNATVEELARLPEIPVHIAEGIYEFFRLKRDIEYDKIKAMTEERDENYAEHNIEPID